ncbi:thioredoxin [Candidatus Peribacteria bacterium]|nr:MAG: thioredoxin [Candidatus Peribacteria bacterium]
MSHVINDADFESVVLKSDVPVLVDFWAPWCGPCKAMTPIMEELEQAYAGKVKIAKMNVDENMDVPGKFNVMSIPTFIIVKNGAVVSQFVGARSKADMQKELDNAIAA